MSKKGKINNKITGCSPIPVETFRDILEDNGYNFDRSKGGHETWEKTVKKSITIPIHGDVNGAMARRLDKEHDLGIYK